MTPQTRRTSVLEHRRSLNAPQNALQAPNTTAPDQSAQVRPGAGLDLEDLAAELLENLGPSRARALGTALVAVCAEVGR